MSAHAARFARRGCRLAWLAGLSLVTRVACAERVVLLEPAAPDQVLEEAYNRLRGELAAYGFEVVQVGAEPGSTPQRLELAADRAQGVAAISFVRSPSDTTIDLWISDRATGKTTLRRLSTGADRDAPRTLAMRAVDLLRASLRELSEPAGVPPDVVGAHPERAPSPVRLWAAPPPSSWAARLELIGFLPLAVSAPGAGFGAGVEYGFTEVVWLRAELSTRLGGASVTYDEVSAELRHQLGSIELALHPWTSSLVDFEAAAGGGALRLGVTGSASGEYAGRSDESWFGALSAGAGFSAALGSKVRLGLMARWLALLPRPVLHLGDGEIELDSGMLMLSSSLQVRF